MCLPGYVFGLCSEETAIIFVPGSLHLSSTWEEIVFIWENTVEAFLFDIMRAGS